MRDSPLQLEELCFPTVSVRALVPQHDEFERQEIRVQDLTISFDLRIDEDGRSVGAALSISSIDGDSENPAYCYKFEIEVFARFVVSGPEHDDERAIYLRKFAAASAMIGAAREQLSVMTARAPWGTAYLPMITIDQIIQRDDENISGTHVVPKQKTVNPRPQKKRPHSEPGVSTAPAKL